MRKVVRNFVIWFLKNLYESLAWGYDFVACIVSFGQWHNWNYQISNFLLKDEKILELGIGTGVLHKNLLLEGFQLFGCDLSSQMLAISTKRLKQPEQKLIRADNQKLPFTNCSFQKIIATFPSDYVFSNQFWRECSRLLTDEGELIILLSVVFEKYNILNFFYRILYQVSGQAITKDNVEKAVFDMFDPETDRKIVWYPYKNVELCFLSLKNK
ncbi:MAG: class I SAM-dependent methyltransferase [Anaerolineaceae bacterium]|nr:class I SAM-dependent methyltransferase [Anaerolineaceae bacterium]